MQLEEGDQVLLSNEPFRIDPMAPGTEPVVQLVWTPGPNPCRFCWETDSRFFQPSADEQ